jgi:hypothetical protein
MKRTGNNEQRNMRGATSWNVTRVGLKELVVTFTITAGKTLNFARERYVCLTVATFRLLQSPATGRKYQS